MNIHRATAAAIAAVFLASASSDVIACGDKFLRPGRSSRQARYAAANPASILIVKGAKSTASGLKDWQKMLNKAGHKSLVVEGGSGVLKALAGQAYDLVIADYNDVAGLNPALQAASAHPALIPVLNKSTQAFEARARAEYHSVINPSAMTPSQALQEIDQLMEFRVKKFAGAGAR